MLIILHIIFSVVAISFAAYGLITNNFEFQHYMIFFLGLLMLVMGIQEFKKERKVLGWLLVVVFLFLLFVSINSWLFY
ncbi:DUF3953 domain-containing protein [Virgibacillus sp. L01]|uniref:DUF3953 domain-containing protein n=1 Tax=Virgibacillus sp. L01 TaxID=3457429 RepID=UPI003FD0B5CA